MRGLTVKQVLREEHRVALAAHKAALASGDGEAIVRASVQVHAASGGVMKRECREPAKVVTRKVGKNKGRPRIWLDGKLLVEAGFVGGTTYYCFVWCDTSTRAGRVILHLADLDEGTPPDSRRHRKVTGRLDGKPIIDILGADVERAFPGAERVRVTFAPGAITITREDAP